MESGLGIRLLLQYAQICKILCCQIPSAKDKLEQSAWYLWDRRGVPASEEQFLEQFLAAIISASTETTFAVD